MINAKNEIIEHIGIRDVELVRIVYVRRYDEVLIIIEGILDHVLPFLDFDYDNGYGCQLLHGYIWYTDGTWSSRREYDGSECWKHHIRPPKDIKIDL